MGTILAKDVVAEVASILQDNNAASRRWPDGELLKYLNDGQREMAVWKPSLSTQITPIQLVAGTKQDVPEGVLEILRFTRNMGVDGATPGSVVTMCSMDDMDHADPDWHTATADAVVVNVMYDTEEDQLHFYVSPPQPAVSPSKLEAVQAISPAEATINGVNGGVADSAITMDDIYKFALEAYMLYRAYSKERDYARDPVTAGINYQAFLHAIGVQPPQPQQG